MTTDKLSQALIDLLDANKPHDSLSVADARSDEDIEIPVIVVECGTPEPHSLAMPGVNRVPVTITLRCSFGDDGVTRAVATSWADSIERLLNQPDTLRDYISASGNGVQCHMIQMASAGTEWDEAIFEAGFEGQAMVTRAG